MQQTRFQVSIVINNQSITVVQSLEMSKVLKMAIIKSHETETQEHCGVATNYSVNNHALSIYNNLIKPE